MPDIDPYDLTDEELEKAFREAKAAMAVDAANEDTTVVEQTTVEDDTTETDEDTQVEVDGVEATENSEQPVAQDSNDNAETDDTKIEVDGTQPEQTEETNVVVKEVEQVAVKHKFKANGKEFEFTDDEIKKEFGKVFAKAMDYTQKTQALAPYKGMIAAIKEQNLTQEDLNLAIEVLKGDKKALAAIIKRTGVDALELDNEQVDNYRPNNYSWDNNAIELQEVFEDISKDPEYPITYHVVEKQWDSSSKEEFRKNPELIRALHIDVKNGMYDKVSPLAMKMKVLDGGRRSDIDYYIMAGQEYTQSIKAQEAAESRRIQELAKIEAANKAEQDRIAKAKAEQAKREQAQNSVEQKKAAALTTSKAGKKDVIDLLEDSDEAFEKWYKAKIENR